MDRRNQPVPFWGDSVAFWWRLWQNQIEYSLRFWGVVAERIPHPNAAELAAEAEAMREICQKRSDRERLSATPPFKSAESRSLRQLH